MLDLLRMAEVPPEGMRSDRRWLEKMEGAAPDEQPLR